MTSSHLDAGRWTWPGIQQLTWGTGQTGGGWEAGPEGSSAVQGGWAAGLPLDSTDTNQGASSRTGLALAPCPREALPGPPALFTRGGRFACACAGGPGRHLCPRSWQAWGQAVERVSPLPWPKHPLDASHFKLALYILLGS